MMETAPSLPVGWQKISPAVYRADAPFLAVDDAGVRYLQSQVVHSPLGRVRLCAHTADGDMLHEMLIVLAAESYVRPHKHVGRAESYHLLDGDMRIVLFNDEGDVSDVVALAARGQGKTSYFRLGAEVYHMVLALTPTLTFWEATPGPLRPESTVFAPWAPAPDDTVAVSSFVASVRHRLTLSNFI